MADLVAHTNSSSGAEDTALNIKVMKTALLTSTMLMLLKFVAYYLTGSSAILSDALESIINVVAGAFAIVSVILAAKPPDEDHPYGHGKIEYFSAGFEGALIIFAAMGIFIEGIHQILHPQPLSFLGKGLLILLLSGTVNLALGLIIIRTGKQTGSLTLLADGKHILTDVYTSVWVLLGVGVVYFTEWLWMDGVVACCAGVNIVISGGRLVRQAFTGLMDESDPELLEDICALLATNRKEVWIDIHKLRAWRSGPRVHIDFHLILPRDMLMSAAHLEVKQLEALFQNRYKGLADVLIHLDPCEPPQCPACNNDPCDMREEDKAVDSEWKREVLISDAE